MVKKIRGLRDKFDKHIMASAYAEVGAEKLSKELIENQGQKRKSKRRRVSQRPRLQMRTPR